MALITLEKKVKRVKCLVIGYSNIIIFVKLNQTPSRLDFLRKRIKMKKDGRNKSCNDKKRTH